MIFKETKMENETLLMQCGATLENCMRAMSVLDTPIDRYEMITEVNEVLASLNELFGLKKNVRFSELLEKRSNSLAVSQ